MVGAITSTGQYFNPTRSKPFKEDQLGHQWLIFCSYTVSRAEAGALMDGDTQFIFDAESLADVTPIACYKCELTAKIAFDHPCPGEPKGYNADGSPIHYERWVREAMKNQ